ncbi:MAG: pro-sigmaK processing inhibitor BofA family protein [Candidatus Limivicinus sp.]|jgi:inhibitor of the pro-sigma K processing machinery
MDIPTVAVIAIVILAVYAFIRLMAAPIKLALKLLLHAGLGFLLLLLTEFISGFFDFSLGISWFNCIVAGFLGVPGVILLILIKIFL